MIDQSIDWLIDWLIDCSIKIDWWLNWWMDSLIDRTLWFFKGGVLEPEGTVEIRYRKKELIANMHRLDPECLELDSQLTKTTAKLERDHIERRIRDREQNLLPIYHQVALRFADLHDRWDRCRFYSHSATKQNSCNVFFLTNHSVFDRPGRMMEKGVILDIVPWRNSRHFFYCRLYRLILENELRKQISEINPDLTVGQNRSMLRRWFIEAVGAPRVKTIHFFVKHLSFFVGDK